MPATIAAGKDRQDVAALVCEYPARVAGEPLEHP
jgi:hypothetical protein